MYLIQVEEVQKLDSERHRRLSLAATTMGDKPMDLSTLWTAVSYIGTGLGGAFLSKVVDAISEARRREDEGKAAEADRAAEARVSETRWLRDQVNKLEGRVEQLIHQLDQTQEELAASRERKAVLTHHVHRLEQDAQKAAEREGECLRLNQALSAEVTALRARFQDLHDSFQTRSDP